jgi:glycosyltransferase involved in cell wall biosynthesis
VGLLIASLGYGGAERMVLALARALIAAGYEIRLFCLDIDREMPLPGDERERAIIDRSIVVLGRGASSAGTLRKALAMPRLVWRLARATRAARLGLVISFMERANILNLLGGTRPPRFVSIRKHPTVGLAGKTALKRWLVRVGYRLLLTRCCEINFNSAEAAEAFLAVFPAPNRPVSVIPNFFDDDIQEHAREPSEASAADLPTRPFILTCGRLVRAKGQAALLRSYAEFAGDYPDIDLVILGDGPLRNDLKATVDALGLADRVRLPGFDPNPYRWMGRCLLFVLPSRAEGFPNALLEAMALGKAIVASDCHSGPRELLAPDTPTQCKTNTVEFADYGVLTAPLDPVDAPVDAPLSPPEAALASGLRRLLADEALRNAYAQCAWQRAQAFRHDAVLAAWLERVRQHVPAPAGEGPSETS